MHGSTWLNITEMKINERGAVKRRSSSPRCFPRKLHISEEKVAEELGNLSIGLSSTGTKNSPGKVDFLFNGTKRNRTFQELEESLDVENVDNVNNDQQGKIELAPELVAEIKKMSRKILTVGSYKPSIKRSPSQCQELVLWKPPSGAVASIMNMIKANEESTMEGTCQRLHKKHENSLQSTDCVMSDIENCDSDLNQSIYHMKDIATFNSHRAQSQKTNGHKSRRQSLDYDFTIDYMEL